MAAADALRAAQASALALVRQGRLAAADRLYDRLRQVAPDDPLIAFQQGAALLLGDDNDRAQRHFQTLIQAHPLREDAWQGFGKALYDGQRPEDAARAFTRAAELSRHPARALYHRGLCHLVMGRFEAGWPDHEHRLAIPEFRHRHFPRPRWDGATLAGRHLLVICEQGYGDVLQFARFLPVLRQCAGTVSFECPADLRDILAPLLDGIRVVPLTGRAMPDIAFDSYVSLLSVPYRLGLGLAGIAEQADLAGRAYLARPGPRPNAPRAGLRIGVCWAGSPSHPQDRHRSMDPEFLAPLATLPGVTLVSFQKDATQRPPLPGLCPFLREPEAPLTDFMATARVMMGLDLVVTVDTSVAHLAAGLGRPVWLMLSRAQDWRWLTERTDSPWYPTMRIFRQPRLGDWPGVVADVRAALAATLTGAAGKGSPG